MVADRSNEPVAYEACHNCTWRLAELGKQGKQPAESYRQRVPLRLLLNFTLLSADPILQTIIHLRPLNVPGVDFVDCLGYPQTACDEHAIFGIAYWPVVLIVQISRRFSCVHVLAVRF